MFEKFNANFLQTLTSARTITMIVVTLVFIIAAVYVYRQYIKPRISGTYVPNKEFVPEEDSEEDTTTSMNGTSTNADMYFFYTTWCPHCKNAMPVWNKLKQETPSVNNVKINYIEVDCDKDKDLAEKYKVEGFPTIKLVYNGRVIEYDAKPELDTLHQFLTSSI